MVRKLVFIFLAFLMAASLAGGDEDCGVYFVYSDSCPHCRAMMPFIQYLEANYSDFHPNYVEAGKNRDLVERLSEKYNTTVSGVPRFFIGGKVFIGYTRERGELEYNEALKGYMGYQNQIFSAVMEHLGYNSSECEMPEVPVHEEYPQANIFLILLIYLVTYPIMVEKIGRRLFMAGFVTLFIVIVFLFIAMTPEQYIKEYAQRFPFPVFVFIIALADGFNPCAFTVLIILLSLLTHTKSKRKMGLIGGVFIATSAIMYFAFIMSLMWLGSWVFGEHGETILKFLGVLVLFAGALNLKDYFFFKKGLSLTLSSSRQKDITKRARKVVKDVDAAGDRKALAAALFATAGLAAFVNLVELGCTAILPAVYMASLFQSFGESIGAGHVVYTAFYSLVYVVPLFAILGNFIYYFKSDRISEGQGKVLKLAGGLLMVTFGIIMLTKPQLLMF